MRTTPSKRAPGRKQRERATHRQEILAAAERVFAERGYHGATIEHIARAAEFAVGTVYNFFRSKDELYVEVFRALAADFLGQFRTRVLAEPDPVRALRAVFDLRLAVLAEHRSFVRMVVEMQPGPGLTPGHALPRELAGVYDRYLEDVSGVFARGMKAGLFERHDPLYLTLMLEGVLTGFVGYWARRRRGQDWRAGAEQLKLAFLEHLRPVPKPKGGGAR